MISFDELWEHLLSLQGHVFHTLRGMPFTYSIHGGVMRIDRKKGPITNATVELAYNTAVAANGSISGPKALRCFGASYIYAIFQKIGLMTTPMTKNKEENDMPRPKGSKNKPTMTLDEQIEKLTQDITALKEQVKTKEAELVRLKNVRDEETMKELMVTIASSGKSVADVIALIKNTEGET